MGRAGLRASGAAVTNNFSATIPVEHMAAANAELEAQGHGPGNFSVPLRDGAAEATHAGLHAWGDPVFLAHVQALDYTGLVVTTGDNTAPNFEEHTQAQALEWGDQTEWFENPIMKGDERDHTGKTWVSLVDYNVWEPPIYYLEVVESGYPAWVQPVGAPAYPLEYRVTHNGSDWESTTPDNVWEPGVFGWTELVAPEPGAWAPGQAVSVGDLRTYQGTTYRCLLGHTTQSDWTPDVVPTLWEAVE